MIIGGWEVAAIVFKALAYAGSLLAAGVAIYRAVFANADDAMGEQARRIGGCAALIGIVATLVSIPLKVAILVGGAADAMGDWSLYAAVLGTGEGLSIALRCSGLAVLAIMTFSARDLTGLYSASALAVWASFGVTGHTPEHGALWSALVVLHLAAVSYWLGALLPLRQLCLHPDTVLVASVMKRFGDIAALVVAVLVVAGILLLWRLLPALSDIFFSDYGRILLFKILVVAGLLGLAAANKWRFVPALAAGSPDAPWRLRRSITQEVWLAGVILIATAIITTVTGPAMH